MAIIEETEEKLSQAVTIIKRLLENQYDRELTSIAQEFVLENSEYLPEDKSYDIKDLSGDEPLLF